MSYSFFSGYYDGLTENVGYKERSDYLAELCRRHGHQWGTTLDLACGTGSLTLELYKRGIDIFGADASADMLAEAQQKAYENGAEILYICQKMQELELYGGIDTCICTLDSINHLTAPGDVRKTFCNVARYMTAGGLFIFDVNTLYKHRIVLGNNCFVYDTDEVFCVWQNELDEKTDTVRIILDFFVPDGKGYQRECEEFSERAYTDNELIDWLGEAGFEVRAIYDDMTFEEPKEKCERKFFVAERI